MLASIAAGAGVGHGRACGDGQRGPRRARCVGYPVPGPGLPQRVRDEAADQRAGGGVPVRAPGLPVPVPDAVQPDWSTLPPRGAVVRRGQRHPVGQVRQGRRQARRDDATSAPPGCHGDLGGGRDRGGPGVPAGVDRRRRPDFHRHPTVVVLQGRPAGHRVLLLPVGRRLRPRLRQGLRLLSLPGQGLDQRA